MTCCGCSPGIGASEDMRRLFWCEATKGAQVRVMVTAVEELRTYAGTSGDELPTPQSHARRKAFGGPVEGLPIDRVKMVARDRKIMVVVPIGPSVLPEELGVEGLEFEPTLFFALAHESPAFVEQAMVCEGDGLGKRLA